MYKRKPWINNRKGRQHPQWRGPKKEVAIKKNKLAFRLTENLVWIKKWKLSGKVKRLRKNVNRATYLASSLYLVLILNILGDFFGKNTLIRSAFRVITIYLIYVTYSFLSPKKLKLFEQGLRIHLENNKKWKRFLKRFKVESKVKSRPYKKHAINKKRIFSKTKRTLAIKLTKLKLEKTILSTIGVNTRVNIKSVFTVLNPQVLDQYIPKIARFWRNKIWYFNDFKHILYYALFFKNSYILARFISRHITNKKSHFYFLKTIKRSLVQFFPYSIKFNLLGLAIKVHGKFQGKLRKRRFKLDLGKTSNTTLDTIVDYELRKSYTKFGVFSIKVFMFFSKENLYSKKGKSSLNRI